MGKGIDEIIRVKDESVRITDIPRKEICREHDRTCGKNKATLNDDVGMPPQMESN